MHSWLKKIQRFKDSRIQKFKNSRIQKKVFVHSWLKNSRIQRFKNSKIQGFNFSEAGIGFKKKSIRAFVAKRIQRFKNSKIQRFKKICGFQCFSALVAIKFVHSWLKKIQRFKDSKIQKKVFVHSWLKN